MKAWPGFRESLIMNQRKLGHESEKAWPGYKESLAMNQTIFGYESESDNAWSGIRE